MIINRSNLVMYTPKMRFYNEREMTETLFGGAHSCKCKYQSSGSGFRILSLLQYQTLS